MLDIQLGRLKTDLENLEDFIVQLGKEGNTSLEKKVAAKRDYLESFIRQKEGVYES